MPRTVVILWNNPADIVPGTPLSGSQLNAVAKDETGAPVDGAYEYDLKEGTVLDPGTHHLRVTFNPADPHAYQSATKSVSINVRAADMVAVSGTVKFGDCTIDGVKVKFMDLETQGESTAETKDGVFTTNVVQGHNIQIELPSCTSFQGQPLSLKGPQYVLCRPCKSISLPDIFYESRGCQITGSLRLQLPGIAGYKPLPNLSIFLYNCEHQIINTSTSDQAGHFCVYTEQTGLLRLEFDKPNVGGNILVPSKETVDVYVAPDCPSSVCIPTITYTSPLAQVCGQVNDGTRGLECVRVELLDAGGKCVASTQSTTGGVWTILNLSPGTYQVRYPAQFQSNGKSLELPEQQRAQTFEIKAGELKCLDTASYGPESHILNVPVTENGRPADGILVEVWSPGAPYPVLTKFTEKGLASFPLKERGTYEVRVYQDRKAAASPLREIIEVQ